MDLTVANTIVQLPDGNLVHVGDLKVVEREDVDQDEVCSMCGTPLCPSPDPDVTDVDDDDEDVEKDDTTVTTTREDNQSA